jgi:hypothetical protein
VILKWLADYFDLVRVYEAVRTAVAVDDYMKKATEFGGASGYSGRTAGKPCAPA